MAISAIFPGVPVLFNGWRSALASRFGSVFSACKKTPNLITINKIVLITLLKVIPMIFGCFGYNADLYSVKPITQR
jgi:hypothetical protein